MSDAGAMQAVTVQIPGQDLDLILHNAREARIGGASAVRRPSDRDENLARDQVIGQLCHYAVVWYLTGSAGGYVAAREFANRDRYRGDCGRDVPGFPIDVKGSLARGERALQDYRLLVRPRERRENWVYVLALVESLDRPKVRLMGWAIDSDLPEPEEDGLFRGAHCLWADELRPMETLKRAVQATLEKQRQTKGATEEGAPACADVHIHLAQSEGDRTGREAGDADDAMFFRLLTGLWGEPTRQRPNDPTNLAGTPM
jgi:hypothetical protein